VSPACAAAAAFHLGLLKSIPHDIATFGIDRGDIISRGQ